jgi:hypothetical protein
MSSEKSAHIEELRLEAAEIFNQACTKRKLFALKLGKSKSLIEKYANVNESNYNIHLYELLADPKMFKTVVTLYEVLNSDLDHVTNGDISDEFIEFTMAFTHLKEMFDSRSGTNEEKASFLNVMECQIQKMKKEVGA